jgi:hypothetical protein
VAGGLSKVCRFGAQALEYYWLAQQGVLRHPIRSHTISLVYALVYRPFLYSSAMAATSSRQKTGMSGTTRPQTEWKAGERRRDTSPTISWAAWKGP